MSVALAMMVRRESAVIERCLTAALPSADSWIVLDTGSTDDTIERIHEIAAHFGVAGKLIQAEWIDFGASRNMLLDNARRLTNPDDYLMLVDADIEVEGDVRQAINYNAGASQDAYDVVVTGRTRYLMPYVLRSGTTARYAGRTHECLVGLTDTPGVLDGVEFYHHGDGGSKADKFERDHLLLLRESTDPRGTRSISPRPTSA